MWKVSYILLDKEGKRLIERSNILSNAGVKNKDKLNVKSLHVKSSKSCYFWVNQKSYSSQTDAKTIKMFHSKVIMYNVELHCRINFVADTVSWLIM